MKDSAVQNGSGRDGSAGISAGTFPFVNRAGKVVRLIAAGLAVGGAIAGCAVPSLKLVNDTSATVTVQSCAGHAPHAQQCSAAVTIAPSGSAHFPFQKPGSRTRLVVISGYDDHGQPGCIDVPTTNLQESAQANVTDADSLTCTDGY
jgi:hypothetical protein